ncbi:hypothetical protein VPNG_05567 [Cytospora leucostoma]|uniref:Uncharacterized protein n=1 Tax=Cytospora leucostoma TaxID=1230097 RepID=A0A423X6X0_9PEZI|nr:hypothetical protein VPNG_05567 [Cytospora leucostoma]
MALGKLKSIHPRQRYGLQRAQYGHRMRCCEDDEDESDDDNEDEDEDDEHTSGGMVQASS